jgi:hypothetical protein
MPSSAISSSPSRADDASHWTLGEWSAMRSHSQPDQWRRAHRHPAPAVPFAPFQVTRFYSQLIAFI